MLIEKDLDEMSYEEFKEMIDNYAEEASDPYDETPTSPFFEHMFQRGLERVQQTTHLTLRVVDGELEFVLPPTNEASEEAVLASLPSEESTIETRGNQILVRNKVIVVTLENVK